MRRLYAIKIMLLISLAAALLIPTLASAEVALWLVSGAEVVALTSVEIPSDILLEDMKTPIGGVDMECLVTFDGSIGPNGEDEITEFLTPTGKPIPVRSLGGSQTEGDDECKVHSGCETSAETAMWPGTLPMATSLELMNNGQILDVFSRGSIRILCLVLGTVEEDECTFATGAVMENMTLEGALDTFNSESEASNCQIGGEAAALIEGFGTIKTLTGLEVSVTSP